MFFCPCGLLCFVVFFHLGDAAGGSEGTNLRSVEGLRMLQAACMRYPGDSPRQRHPGIPHGRGNPRSWQVVPCWLPDGCLL